MPTLLDAMRGAVGGAANQPTTEAPAAESETEKARKLLLAKSGKAGAAAGSGPRVSNIGEQAAQAQTAQQMQQVQQQAQVGEQQVAGQQEQLTEEARQTEAGAAQARTLYSMQLRMQTNDILGQYQRSGKQLDIQKERAVAEQVGFGIRLSNKAYTDRLQQEGQRKRLDNQIAFNEELTRSIMGDNVDLLKTKLGNQNVLTASDRDFKKAMEAMSILDAAKIARAEARAAAHRQKWQAVSGMAKGIIGASAGAGGEKGLESSQVSGASGTEAGATNAGAAGGYGGYYGGGEIA